MPWDDTKETFNQLDNVPDDQKLTASEYNALVSDVKSHAGRHENGGVDEISVSGLSGVLDDSQHPIQEDVEDYVASLVDAGDKLSWSYNDGNDTLTIDTTALDAQEVKDEIDDTIAGGTQVSTSYDDTTLTITIDSPSQSEFDGHVSDYDSHVTDFNDHSTRHESGGADEINVGSLSGVLADPQPPIQEDVEDYVNGLLTEGSNITLTYDDGAGTLTIDASASGDARTDEEIEDVVAALLAAGNATTLTYDDENDTLTIAVDESAISHDEIDQATVTANQHHTRPDAGDGLTDDTDTFNINVSDFAGALLNANGGDLDVDESAISHDGIDQTTVTASQHHTRPDAGDGITDDSDTFNINVSDFAGTLLIDETGDLAVDESAISHDGIDQATVTASQHHTRPSAGDGLTDDTDTFNINVADFAGTLLTSNGGDLDVLEGDISHDGIDQSTVTASQHHTRPDAGDYLTDDSDTFNFDEIQYVIDHPNGNIPTAEIEDEESAEIGVPVEDGETLTVYRWGCWDISDSTNPTDLDVELLDDSDTVDTSENTGNTTNTSGIASLTNNSGDGTRHVYKLRVANDTGGTIVAGAIFSYKVA